MVHSIVVISTLMGIVPLDLDFTQLISETFVDLGRLSQR